jgi:hypothetical protein
MSAIDGQLVFWKDEAMPSSNLLNEQAIGHFAKVRPMLRLAANRFSYQYDQCEILN